MPLQIFRQIRKGLILTDNNHPSLVDMAGDCVKGPGLDRFREMGEYQISTQYHMVEPLRFTGPDVFLHKRYSLFKRVSQPVFGTAPVKRFGQDLPGQVIEASGGIDPFPGPIEHHLIQYDNGIVPQELFDQFTRFVKTCIHDHAARFNTLLKNKGVSSTVLAEFRQKDVFINEIYPSL